MDQKLKLQHDVETCQAIASAVAAMMNEIIDNGGNSMVMVERMIIVFGLLQDRLGEVKVVADNIAIDGLT